MRNKLFGLLRGTVRIYLDKQIPRAAAAMSYYLTMSLFPLLICLYTLLGRSYGRMLEILDLVDRFLSPEATRYVKSFLLYIANNPSSAMFFAGLLLLLTSASAAMRVMRQEMREIRGGGARKGKGLRDWLVSIIFSLIFLAALYFGILVLLTGQTFLEFIERYVPALHISRSWRLLRYLVLGCLAFLALWGMYAVSSGEEKRRGGKAPGALIGTAGIVLMSLIFSQFIAVSTRYPLVYGSLASIILLMFWLFLCSQMIFLGAAVNRSLQVGKSDKE